MRNSLSGEQCAVDGRLGRYRLAILTKVLLLADCDHSSYSKHQRGHNQVTLDVFVGAVSSHKRIISVVLQVDHLHEGEPDYVHPNEEEEYSN